MLKSYFVILALFTITAAQSCRKFICAPNGVVDSNDHTICARKNGIDVTVGDCAQGMFCDMNDLDNTTIHCHNKFSYKKLSGQKFVHTPQECFNGMFDKEGFCRGKAYGASCSNNGDADCDVDLYCDHDRKTCMHAIQVGESCDNNKKCASNLLCAFEDGSDYRCRNYGIYPNDKSLGPGDEDDICQSNYMDNDYYCREGPRLTSPHLRETPGEKCLYTRGDAEVSHCWYHAGGKAICKKGAGDLMNEWKLALSYLAMNPKCHITIPMSQCDMGRKVVKTDEEWEKIWFAISRIHWEMQLEGVAECMKQYVHPEAFIHKRSYSGSLLPLSLVSLIALVLIML